MSKHTALWFLLFVASPSGACPQELYGEFTCLKKIDIPAASLPIPNFNDDPVAGFSYCRGKLWCLTPRGHLLVIDTSGSSLSPLMDTPILGAWYGAGIHFDGDTLWIASSTEIIPMDTLGQRLGSGIPLTRLNEQDPFNAYYASGLTKDANGFWILQGLNGLLYHISRSGKVTKQFPNAWFCYHWANNNNQLTWLAGRLLISTGNVPPSNGQDLWSATTIDTCDGSPKDEWGYPEPYSWSFEYYFMHVGFSAGENCLWLLERLYGDAVGLRIRKIAIPSVHGEPNPLPGSWGDFPIQGWNYTPIQGGSIEGIYGLAYRPEKQELWINANIGTTLGYQAADGRYFSPLGCWWNSYYTDKYIPRDICFVGDSMWVVDYWPGMVTAMIHQVSLMADGSVVKNVTYDVGFEQMDGIATDGKSLWVSGRTSAPSTGMPANEIKKVSLTGEELQHFAYPDSYPYNYADLTWQDSSLWAVAMNAYGDTASIHQIDPSTGKILRRLQTGWERPASNINGNLASDGKNLLMIAVVDSGSKYRGALFSYENTHERLLRLVPPALPAVSNTDESAGDTPREYTLSQNYPNPFNSTTVISFHLPIASGVKLAVYDLLGREVAVLVNEVKPLGTYSVRLDGSGLASGVYFYTLRASSSVQTRECCLLR